MDPVRLSQTRAREDEDDLGCFQLASSRGLAAGRRARSSSMLRQANLARFEFTWTRITTLVARPTIGLHQLDLAADSCLDWLVRWMPRATHSEDGLGDERNS
jgi:hypothetical protein